MRSTNSVNEEPVVVIDDIIAKEECSTNETLREEVAGKSCDPVENRESGAALEDKERDRLLEEETDNDRRPRNRLTVRRCQEESALENKQAEYGDRAVCVLGVLFVRPG